MERVVITGSGIHSCIGESLEEVRDSLFNGKSGIVIDQDRKDFGFRSGLTGAVREPDLKKELSRRERIGMSEQAKYAYLSTVQALEQAGIDQDHLENNEVGILFGNDSVPPPLISEVEDAASIALNAVLAARFISEFPLVTVCRFKTWSPVLVPDWFPKFVFSESV